jgi:hypothetical protein
MQLVCGAVTRVAQVTCSCKSCRVGAQVVHITVFLWDVWWAKIKDYKFHLDTNSGSKWLALELRGIAQCNLNARAELDILKVKLN